ncbi:electron carrier [Coemansia thaxteri]|nr:electron carrier [Coemansia thaxteri]
MSHHFTAKPGQAVLLVARASGDAQNLDDLQRLRDSLQAQVGTGGRVDFEQVDRIEEGAAVLSSAQYDAVVASPIAPHTVEHSSRVLGQLLLALKPSGTLELHEAVRQDSSKDGYKSAGATRTQQDLTQQLKFAGFVEIQTEAQQPSGVAASGPVVTARILAAKPAYNVGAAAALSFGKRAKAGSEAVAKRAWMLNVDSDSDEAEIEDQDGLLEEEDLAKPSAASLVRPDGAAPKRKACKNCTCGLAEGKEVDESAGCAPTDKPKRVTKPVDVVTVKSACGNCSLGDAFRCTSCPYLGQPAFKPGEKVVLGGSMLHDDFMP